MYKYKLKEEASKVSEFQEERINAFDEIEKESSLREITAVLHLPNP